MQLISKMESKLFLLLLLLTSLVTSVPLIEKREEHHYTFQEDNIKIGSGDKGFFDLTVSNDYTMDGAIIPEYMTSLYECWQKEEHEMKNCLQSVDDILKIDEIVNFTNTITGFIGQGIQDDQNHTAGPEYQLVRFNISRVKMYDNLLSSELRFYKEAIDIKALEALSSDICSLSDKGVVLSLLVDLNGQDHIIERTTISTDELLTDKWIVFYNFKSLLSEWIQNDNHTNNKTFKLVLQGGCAGIHPENIGFRFKEDPLLVVFLKKQNSYVDDPVIQKMATKMAEAVAANRQATRNKRQTDNNINNKKWTNSHFCQLHHYNINFTALGYNDFIIGPREYQANFCAGICSYPLSDHQNGTLHSQLIALANYKEPSLVPGPCCVPTKLQSQTLIVKFDKFAIEIKTYPGMVAKQCGCR